MKPINSTKKGERIAIKCMQCSHEDTCLLQDLGCFEGVIGEVLSNNSRVILKIGDTRLAISESLANTILITPQ